MLGSLIHGGVIRKLVLAAGGRYLGGEIHEAANGNRGTFLRRLYLWSEGKKTITGLVLGAVAAALPAFGLDSYQQGLGYVAGLLVSVGLLDKAWRSRPSWAAEPAWVFARDHWADIVVLLGGAATALTKCDGNLPTLLAHLHLFGLVLTCHGALLVVTGLTAVGGWLFAEAKVAAPPVTQWRRAEG